MVKASTDPESIQLLRRLVSIPSVNPAFGDEVAVCGEEKLACFLSEHLAEKGFQCRLAEYEPGRPNLIAVGGSSNPRKVLAVEGHLDTVSIRGMTIDPFAGETRSGRLYGRGACDMKGAWAAFLAALAPDRLAALRDAGVQLTVIGAMGEETGNEGARALVDQCAVRADEAVVLEPTGLVPVISHKGIAWFRIRFRGRSGHGSDPARGLNAIEGALAAIPVLRAGLEQAAAPDSGWGMPTFNVGRIHGGEGVNTIAGECILEVDCRIVPGDDQEGVRGRFEAVLAAMVADGRLSGYGVDMLKACRPYAASASSGLVSRLRRACLEGGVRAEPAGTAWYSDAGPLSEVCAETVVFGPGRIDQAHTPDEWIAVEEVCRAAGIFASFLEAMAKET